MDRLINSFSFLTLNTSALTPFKRERFVFREGKKKGKIENIDKKNKWVFDLGQQVDMASLCATWSGLVPSQLRRVQSARLGLLRVPFSPHLYWNGPGQLGLLAIIIDTVRDGHTGNVRGR